MSETISSDVSLAAAPPLPGAICTQYIRCGKVGCRCEGGNLHGPYHYRVWRDGDKVRKIYVRPADLPTVQAQCASYRVLQDRLRQIRTERRQLERSIAGQIRVARRLLHNTQPA